MLSVQKTQQACENGSIMLAASFSGYCPCVADAYYTESLRVASMQLSIHCRVFLVLWLAATVTVHVLATRAKASAAWSITTTSVSSSWCYYPSVRESTREFIGPCLADVLATPSTR